ncbi:DUF1045 domain-containing protein [uncultured Tateyamaria sp.]|uniref:DUF1045 domain-containing protein n=1 Tax=uncultured Tateyamaria sp. TaxID=455651 RepID=UPI00263019B2|nr:DUF1045 domain-containing protein [uncultured Tateyamaria sp.]
MFTRYAVYYTPAPDTAMARFGAHWLGWDSAAGTAVAHPDIPDIDMARITDTPRKYGFHGTIKPPFRLAEGRTEAQLHSALADLCAQSAAVTLNALVLRRLGRFLALVPDDDATALGAVAARMVQDLDAFRAPPTATELEKRRAARLSPAQDAHLVRWGYPYVLDQFRFHLTLTGKLDKPTLARTESVLSQYLAPVPLAPHVINALTLCGEDPTGRFHQIERFALAG